MKDNINSIYLYLKRFPWIYCTLLSRELKTSKIKLQSHQGSGSQMFPKGVSAQWESADEEDPPSPAFPRSGCPPLRWLYFVNAGSDLSSQLKSWFGWQDPHLTEVFSFIFIAQMFGIVLLLLPPCLLPSFSFFKHASEALFPGEMLMRHSEDLRTRKGPDRVCVCVIHRI